MNIETNVMAVRAGMQAWNAYPQIVQTAIALGRGDLLRQLKELLPALEGITVRCDSDYDKGLVYATYIEQILLVFNHGAKIALVEMDVEDFFKYPTTELDDLARQLGHDIAEMESVHAEVEQAVRSIYERLFALVRMDGIQHGEKTYAVSVSVDQPNVSSLIGEHPNLAQRNSWVIYSPSEARQGDDDAGYWSHLYGWTTVDSATIYRGPEKYIATLPVADEVTWRNLLEISMGADVMASMGNHDLDVPGDVSQYSAVEVECVVMAEGHCAINDSDPQFYGLYVRRKDGLAHHVADYWNYQDVTKSALALSLAWRIPVSRTCQDRDDWFLWALNRAFAAQ